MIILPEKHRIECLECNKEFDHIFTDQEIEDAKPKEDGSRIIPSIICPNPKCGKRIQIGNLGLNKK